MADVSVRPARADDVGEIARIQVETWRHGYRDILPPSVLESLTVDAAAAVWRPAIEAPPSSRHHVLAAMEQSWVVGFAAIAPADDLLPDDTDAERTGAVAPLLIEPRWGRRGHGSRLLAACVDTMRLDGMARALSWIPELDTASREFLVGAGWAADGAVRALDTGAGELREIRMHTILGD